MSFFFLSEIKQSQTEIQNLCFLSSKLNINKIKLYTNLTYIIFENVISYKDVMPCAKIVRQNILQHNIIYKESICKSH